MLLPHTRPPRPCSEATEAFALWRGVEAASGARSLLHLCGSIDIAPAGSGAAAAALGAMQEAGRVSCRAFSSACLPACLPACLARWPCPTALL